MCSSRTTADCTNSMDPRLCTRTVVARGAKHPCTHASAREIYHEVIELRETTEKPESSHADMSTEATDVYMLPILNGGRRKRDKFKRFIADKGPRMAGAAATIGMFIFNVVSSCT